MPDKSYRIIYQGKVAQGRTVEEVKRNLASLFKLSAEKTAQLFSGKRVVIAKNVAYTSAMRYKMAFETAGGICKVEEVNSELRLVPPLEMEKDEASKSEPGKAITCPKCGFNPHCAVNVRKVLTKVGK